MPVNDESPLQKWEDQNTRLGAKLDTLAMLADHVLNLVNERAGG